MDRRRQQSARELGLCTIEMNHAVFTAMELELAIDVDELLQVDGVSNV
ncbi:hypothetical protein RFM68_32100 [Mesorhizobium sp. MSK_1335]|uniref:Uncharacterized protein n=1 Tax=Mesorhizobium montanum TaxID=3072323 RepID=A0ABU4ZVQ6_9HYPH|nr:hypothetical protein [Mesorhizobium sp. MSK_1335]MDX8529105.1 hypothetical protein [Mesorhizobium sp. MSK_1335]